MNEPARTELATLGGGCFWCLDAIFRDLRGVTKVESGYAGGATPNPMYEQVCSGRTGHAEVVQITFDPQAISFRELLDVFFVIHDPTTLNRQGADVGTQYRSVILHHSPEQEATARQVIADVNSADYWGAPLVTEIAPFTNFYPAEGYHQNYFELHGEEPYCQAVIAPKVAKFRKRFLEKLKK